MFAALFLCVDNAASLDDREQPKIKTTVTERVIKVEGTLDKPRVLFIVPKAKLWKAEFDKKEFYEELSVPPYPESLVAPEKDGDTIY